MKTTNMNFFERRKFLKGIGEQKLYLQQQLAAAEVSKYNETLSPITKLILKAHIEHLPNQIKALHLAQEAILVRNYFAFDECMGVAMQSIDEMNLDIEALHLAAEAVAQEEREQEDQ